MVAGVGGAGVNVLDISSKYAGIIGGALQTFASCFSLFAPLVVQWICIDMVGTVCLRRSGSDNINCDVILKFALTTKK